MKTLLLAVSVLVLSGCAMTVKDFREDNPATFIAQVPGYHMTMANCLMHRLEENVDTWPDMFRLTTDGTRTSLLISRSQPAKLGLPIVSPLTEFILTQSIRKEVIIETRTRSCLAGNHFIDHAKPFIGHCGQQSLAAS